MTSESYAYQYYGQSAVREALPEVQPKPKTGVKKNKKAKAHAKVKVNTRAKLMVAVFFALVFTVVMRYTVISEMTSQNTSRQKVLQTITAGNEQKAVALERATDLKKVEQVATTQLGMSFPQSHQTVNVTLNHENKTVKVAPTHQNFFDQIKNFVGSVMEYLY